MGINTKNVLIIEDDLMTSDIIKDILKENDFKNLHVAENGAKALEILAEVQIDLITLDNQLPDIFGTELIEKVRDLNSEAQIVVVSSIYSKHISDTLNQFNILAYVHKGNLIDDLNQLIESH
ncbi:MAG: response regulator [Flavobacteriales bacterium]|nr:response regulator [Flavobacteriales bacterium]